MRRSCLFVLPSAWLVALVACANRSSYPLDAGPLESARDGGSAASAEDPGRTEEKVATGPRAIVSVGAMFQTSVLDTPSWPESGTGARRLGYLRHGAVVSAYADTTPNDECQDGWYELVEGGFVCGKALTPDLASGRVRLAPRQPDRDAGLPYRYGVNLVAGTPLYRRVLNAEDRKKYEPRAARVKTSDPASEAERTGEAEVAERGVAPPADNPEGEAEKTAAAASEGTTAAKPRLRDLKGRGVLVRRMQRGFYLALDRDFTAAGARWWRTSFGFAVPFERIMLQQSATKHVGVWFPPYEQGGEAQDGDAGAATLAGAVGFVVREGVPKLVVNEGKDTLGWSGELPKRSAVALTGRTRTFGQVTYHEAASGFYVRLGDLKLVHPAVPPGLDPNEKWVDVDLTRQTLVALEGRRAVFGTFISSGRRNPQDREHDFPTPTGSFRIREKHVTTTMDGDVAADGPYSIEDVPWVMYFHGSYALHGAFWHDSFGHVRSHGCVNLAPEDARTLFAWADPPLPRAWHGVFAAEEKSGTRVVIHEDPAPKR